MNALEHLTTALGILRGAGDVMGLHPAGCRTAIEEIEVAVKLLEEEREMGLDISLERDRAEEADGDA